jgi:dihydroneopterin aldolase
MAALDRIHLHGLELECIVGLRPHERRRAQPVRVDASLGVDLSRAGRSGRILHTIDYSRVATELTTLLKFRAYRLIEMATEEICAMLFASHRLLETAEIRIQKPDALRGRALASVTVQRMRESFPIETIRFDGGERERFLETHEATLDLVRLAPRRSLPKTGLRRLAWISERNPSVDAQPDLGEALPFDTEITSGNDETCFFVCELKSSL